VGSRGVRWFEAFTEAQGQARTEELPPRSDRGGGEQHRPALPQVQRPSRTHARSSLRRVPVMTDCQHEFDPMPQEMIVVTEEMAMKEPLRFDWSPPQIVQCKKCGAPLNRGRFAGLTSHPWAGLGVPLDEDDDS
jgi:hypothetical protein